MHRKLLSVNRMVALCFTRHQTCSRKKGQSAKEPWLRLLFFSTLAGHTRKCISAKARRRNIRYRLTKILFGHATTWRHDGDADGHRQVIVEAHGRDQVKGRAGFGLDWVEEARKGRRLRRQGWKKKQVGNLQLLHLHLFSANVSSWRFFTSSLTLVLLVAAHVSKRSAGSVDRCRLDSSTLQS